MMQKITSKIFCQELVTSNYLWPYIGTLSFSYQPDKFVHSSFDSVKIVGAQKGVNLTKTQQLGIYNSADNNMYTYEEMSNTDHENCQMYVYFEYFDSDRC